MRFCVKERGVADGEVLRDLQEGHHVRQQGQPFKQKIPEDLGTQRPARQRGDRRRSEKGLCLYPVPQIRQGLPRIKHYFDRNKPSASMGGFFAVRAFWHSGRIPRTPSSGPRYSSSGPLFPRQPDSLCIFRQVNSLFSIPRRKRGALKQKILIVHTSVRTVTVFSILPVHQHPPAQRPKSPATSRREGNI
jgi:hypothetical protein